MKTEIKTAEDMLKGAGLTISDSFTRYYMDDVVDVIHAYQEQFTTIWAITNLDAEDLGSSILMTYYTSEDAYAELELIESGEHPEFFRNLNLDVFEIKLPSPPKQ